MSGGVAYANGTEASAPAVYLHHAAIINTGVSARDGTCGRPAYDLFFSTGNERSTMVYNKPAATFQSGHWIAESDVFVLQSEVVNEQAVEQEVWVYFNYEVVLGRLDADAHGDGETRRQRETKVVWLSTEGTPCANKVDLAAYLAAPEKERELGTGELWPPNDGAFVLRSQVWTSPWNGNFVGLGKFEPFCFGNEVFLFDGFLD
jgi:hypothetical protein